MWSRTAGEVDSVEMGFVISVKDDVDAAFLIDPKGADGVLRHRELSQSFLGQPQNRCIGRAIGPK